MHHSLVLQSSSLHVGALVIEFVPKTDSQAHKLLASRKDIFPGYNQEGFEGTFGEFFSVGGVVPVP